MGLCQSQTLERSEMTRGGKKETTTLCQLIQLIHCRANESYLQTNVDSRVMKLKELAKTSLLCSIRVFLLS